MPKIMSPALPELYAKMAPSIWLQNIISVILNTIMHVYARKHEFTLFAGLFHEWIKTQHID